MNKENFDSQPPKYFSWHLGPLYFHVAEFSWNNLEFHFQEQSQRGHTFVVHHLVNIQ